MNCANCGMQQQADEKFCKNCGQLFPSGEDLLPLELAQKPAPAPLHAAALRVLRSWAGAGLTHERLNAILRQAIGLVALMAALFAIAQKPDPGIFILYAIPPLLGSVVVVLERKPSIGKAIFVIAMLLPYFSLLLAGVPPFFAYGVQDPVQAVSGLAGFIGMMSVSSAFLAAGFLFSVFYSVLALIFEKRTLIAGGAALIVTAAFTIVIMGMLGNPATAVAQSMAISEKPDKTVAIHTTALAPDSAGKLTETGSFMSNEQIFAYAGGLAAGTRFGYRVTDESGKTVLPFDRSNAAVAIGTGMEKYPALNTADARLGPGIYVLELLVAKGWKTYAVASAAVTVLPDVNPNYGVQTTDPYSWLALSNGTANTKFTPDDPIDVVLDGSRLQGDVSVMIKGSDDKVLVDKTYSAMPLGKSQYVIADKASALGQGQFVAVLTSQGKEAIVIYFTIS